MGARVATKEGGTKATGGEELTRHISKEPTPEVKVTREGGAREKQKKEATQGQGPIRHEGREAIGEVAVRKRGWRHWNPLRRWLSDLPTPDFNLKIKLYEK